MQPSIQAGGAERGGGESGSIESSLPECRQEAYPSQKQRPPPSGGDVFLLSQVTGLHPQRLGEERVPCREGYWEEGGTSMEVGLILRRVRDDILSSRLERGRALRGGGR